MTVKEKTQEQKIEEQLVAMRIELMGYREMARHDRQEIESLERQNSHLLRENIQFRYKAAARKETIRRMQRKLEHYRLLLDRAGVVTK